MNQLPSAAAYVLGAYLVTALLLGAYIVSLHARARAVARELEALDETAEPSVDAMSDAEISRASGGPSESSR